MNVEALFGERKYKETRRGLIAAIALGLVTVGVGVARETPKNPSPEVGTIRSEKVGAWDPIISTFLDAAPFVKEAARKEWENGREFFAVLVSHDRRLDPDRKGVSMLPLSPDLPKPQAGYDSEVYYVIGRRDGSVTPFPERSGISSLKFTPSTILGREVFGEADEALVNRNVTVVQAGVLGSGVQGKPEPGLATVLLRDNRPARTDAFLQSVRIKFLDRKPPLILEVTDKAPLVVQHFPAKVVIGKDGKLIYTRSDPIA